MQIKKMVSLGLLVTSVFSAGVVIGAQPRMENALRALQEAKSHLQKADHNKGGHRVNAIDLIDKAIAEVKAGMQAAK